MLFILSSELLNERRAPLILLSCDLVSLSFFIATILLVIPSIISYYNTLTVSILHHISNSKPSYFAAALFAYTSTFSIPIYIHLTILQFNDCWIYIPLGVPHWTTIFKKVALHLIYDKKKVYSSSCNSFQEIAHLRYDQYSTDENSNSNICTKVIVGIAIKVKIILRIFPRLPITSVLKAFFNIWMFT